MSHQTISGALPASINKEIVGAVFNFIFAPSSSVSSQNVPAVIRDFLLSRFASSTYATDRPVTCVMITIGLILCFLSFISQITLFTLGLRYSILSNSHWVVRNNELGVCIPNTRCLMAILSLLFTLMLLCESLLLILDMNGISTLRDRTIIAGLKWLPLWLSSWVYSWGMASSIYSMYSQIPNGILGKLTACKHSALVYNALVFGFLASVIIYETTSICFAGYDLIARLHLFRRISARFEAMAASYDPATFSITNDLLPELPGLLEMTQSFETWIKHFCFLLYSRLVWFLAFICLSLPLYYIYFRLIRNVKKYHNSIKLSATRFKSAKPLEGPAEAVEEGCEVRFPIPQSPSRTSFWKLMCSDDTHLILAAALSLGHSLVEVTVMIRFVHLLKTSGNLSAQVALLTNTALITNFISAFTGLVSSWIFFNRSRGSYYKALSYRNNPSSALERSVVTGDLFDTWTVTPSVLGDIYSLADLNKQDGYFVHVRPQLKHFPDIAQVKQLC